MSRKPVSKRELAKLKVLAIKRLDTEGCDWWISSEQLEFYRMVRRLLPRILEEIERERAK